MSRSVSLLFLFVTSLGVAKNNYPVDFEDGFFKKTPFSRWMRDPFRNPTGYVKGSLPKVPFPTLSGITETAKGRTATLNGKQYREGEFLDENRYISAIGQNYVTITEGNFDFELVINDPKRAVASDTVTGTGDSK